MKKLQLSTLLLFFAAFALISCGQDAAEVGLDWESDSRGTLEVMNTSNTDVVLFLGDRPTDSGLLGGVKAGTTRLVNICDKVPDCKVGGWAIINGITRDVYNKNISNLTTVTKIDFNAFATYKENERYRVTIDKNYIGDNMVRLVNKGRVGIELRKGSPEGEKVAYLPALKTDGVLYANSTDAITLFPFYVLYDNVTRSVVTLKATDMKQSVMVSPVPADDQQNVAVAYFPNDPNGNTWEAIVETLESPVAYIKVSNNIMNQAVYFTNAGSYQYRSQSGYNAINSGRQLMFEVESTKDGSPKALMAMIYSEPVAITFEGETKNPVIKNGYDYEVSIDQVGKEFVGTIKEIGKRDLSDRLNDPPTSY